jgi:hypothetical protein
MSPFCIDRGRRRRQHCRVTQPEPLSSVLACPRCGRGPVTLARAGWLCGACSSGFPVIGEVPWLFAEPRQALAEWRDRLNLLAQHLASESNALRLALQTTGLAAATVARLRHSADAYDDQIARLRALLAPLGLDSSGSSEATLRGLGTQLPGRQGLTNYYVNVHRDWCWGAEENAASLEEIRAVCGGTLTGFGRLLVQGAGAGRLAYDLHQACDAALTVATDFNPLLLFVAREMLAGRSVELYEFPIAPRGPRDHAVLRALAPPAPARAGIALVAADALQPPFADGAFDVVLTPWFIDIIGEPFERVASRISLLLKPGGRWINFGSLAFERAGHAGQVTLEEVLELLPRAGFGDCAVREASIPYMRSPASRHARVESVVTWVARKVGEPAEKPRARALPEWLLNPDVPVPRTPALEVEAISSRVHAFLLALINGERSQREMARIIVEQRLMSAQDAEPAVRAFLGRLHEDQ